MIEIRHLLTCVDDRKEALVVASLDGGAMIGTCRVQSFGSHISIARMYVMPDLRREGVGRQMVEYVAGNVAELFDKLPDTILIGCKVKNTTGRAFWLACGFQDIGHGGYELALTAEPSRRRITSTGDGKLAEKFPV